MRNLHFPFGVDRLPSPLIKTVTEFVVEAPDIEEGGKIRTAVSTAVLAFREAVSVSSSFPSSDTSTGLVSGSTDRRDRGRSMTAMQRAIHVTSDVV